MIYLILFLGLILRVISLNQSFWLDEATSATVAKNFSFLDILTKFSPGDFHPPLYYLALKVWTLPFGVTEISARSLSIVFSLATILLVYQISKLYKDKTVAIAAALLTATAPLLIYYAQEARMYSMQTFLVTLAVFLFAKNIQKEKFVHWLLFSLALLLVGATDYLPLLIIPVFWLYGIFNQKKLPWFGKLILSHFPLAIGFAVWAPTFAHQLSVGLSVQASSQAWWQVLGKSNLKELLLVPTKFLIGRLSFTNKFSYALVVVFAAASFGYAILQNAKSVKAVKKDLLFWLWLLVPITLAFLLGFKVSVFSYFRLIFVLPAFYLLIAIGLTKVKEAVFPILFLILIALNITFSLTYLLNDRYHREDWRSAVDFILDASRDKKTAVVFPADSQQEAFKYYAKDGLQVIRSEEIEDHEIVYLVRYVQDISDPADLARKKLEEKGYNKILEKDFKGVIIWQYENRN